VPTRVKRGCGLRLMRQPKVSDPAPFLSFRVEGAQGSRCPPSRREDDMWWPDPELSISVRAHAEAVTGYREWVLSPTPEGPRLRSLWSSTMWKPRELLKANCLPPFGYINAWAWGAAQRRFPHRFAPDPRCRCGIAGRARKGHSSVDGGITRIQGIARGWGLVISWSSGCGERNTRSRWPF
jgi:hypothetical protein